MTPRVAFFSDSFHEVNGVALTSRQLDAFAHRRDLPFLSVHAGAALDLSIQANHWNLELDRTNIAIPLESDMDFDLLFMRHQSRVKKVLRDFRADLIHITGPSDVGILGAVLAYQLNLPIVASWHTNLHEFGARRLERLLSLLPNTPRRGVADLTERGILDSVTRFYRLAKVIMAPNDELCQMLRQRTNRSTFLMKRGVDTNLFSPAKRGRGNDTFTLGFVGRVTPEKGVCLLKKIEDHLRANGANQIRFVIVGDGSEREWLSQNLVNAEFPGVLKDEALSRAYANMDVLLFPSRTDTYGNVVQEAMASAVPAIVTDGGGPKFLVNEGVTGFVCATDEIFLDRTLQLFRDRALLRQMSFAAREHALTLSWDRVFEDVWNVYRVALEPEPLFRLAV